MGGGWYSTVDKVHSVEQSTADAGEVRRRTQHSCEDGERSAATVLVKAGSDAHAHAAG